MTFSARTGTARTRRPRQLSGTIASPAPQPRTRTGQQGDKGAIEPGQLARFAGVERPPVEARLSVKVARRVKAKRGVARPRGVASRRRPIVACGKMSRQPPVTGERRKRREPLVSEHILDAGVAVAAAMIIDRRAITIGVAEPLDARLPRQPYPLIPVHSAAERLRYDAGTE